ncbi:hypothetical protein BJ956_001508 [Arthrobacter psychrochitiniphilus]|nr:hypothetical protein [Arthrobacter psychrochitiniphilus]
MPHHSTNPLLDSSAKDAPTGQRRQERHGQMQAIAAW